jgi:quercetin dioxygenase-like cupin family protein
MPDHVALHRWDDLPLDKLTEMVASKVVPGAIPPLAQTYLKRGTVVPAHRHAGAQLVYVLQGLLRVRAGGRAVTVREGEVLTIPAGTVHHSEALDDTFVLGVGGGPAVSV